MLTLAVLESSLFAWEAWREDEDVSERNTCGVWIAACLADFALCVAMEDGGVVVGCGW